MAFFILMKRSVFAILFLMTFSGLKAQKLIRKSLINSNISSFQIDTGNCFELELTTAVGDELIIEAELDGEYSEDLIVKIIEEGSTFFISTGFRPSFIVPNDKMSVHKVISIALRISLPEYNNVKVTGTNCNVTANGLFSALEVVLDDGNCILNQVGQSASVKTQSGNISLYGTGGIVDAETKYGNIVKNDFPHGDNEFSLYSITGNIHLIKTN